MTRKPADPFAKLPPGSTPASPPRPAADVVFDAVLPAAEPLPAPIRHRDHGAPSHVWRYHDAQGALLFAVVRFERDGGKQILPFTFGTMKRRTGWHWRAPPAPRPLYGLDRLAARPAAPVIVCEGEKAADAATALFADHVAITSPQGAHAARQADWTPLAEREVVIWPDADAPGRAYADEAARMARAAGAHRVRIVRVPDDWPAAWDLADTPPEGVDGGRLRAMLAAEGQPTDFTPATMPAGFLQTADGIVVHGEDDGKPPFFVCGRLLVLAATHDGSGDDWGKLLRWHDDDARVHEWAMPLSLIAGEGADLRARLMSGGLAVGTSRKAREALATYLMRTKPVARVRIVLRIGWHETPGGRVFVLPRETIAPPGAEAVRLQTERHEALPPLNVQGSLAAWQEQVAPLAVGNSRLLLAVSMAFAAPLLGILGAEGGGVHLRGPSSIGKSAAAIVAGSVWGGGGVRGWLQRWRATDNGLEALAATHCDLLLTLDELGEIDPRHLGPAAYMLANGGGKHRAARDGGGRKAAEWRLLFLSCGETSVSDRLAEIAPGRRAAAGQDVRVVDLPADAGKDRGLFETLHGAPSGSAFADRLRAACASHYGSAGPAFLRALMRDAEGSAARVRTCRQDFLASHLPAGADGQVCRVADRFALIGAAGELAAAFGIVPWPAGEATAAAARCFADWRRERGGDGPAEITAGLAQIRRFLEVHGDGRFRLLGVSQDGLQTDGPERLLRAGFRRETPNGTEFFVLPEVWRAEVTAGFDARALAAEMARRGFLRPDPGDGKPACRRSLPGRPKGARAYHLLPALFAAGDPGSAHIALPD